MASQSVPMDELKHDFQVEPDHGGTCNGNINDMDVVVEAELKINGDIDVTRDDEGVMEPNGDGAQDTVETEGAVVDADKENDVPDVTESNGFKSNGEVVKISTNTPTQSDSLTKKQGKTKRRSSSSSSSKHKRSKPKPATATTTMTVSESTKPLLFGLASYNQHQIRDPIVAFETSLESTRDWITWLRLELIEIVFDSTWDKPVEDETAMLQQNYYSWSQVIGEFILIGFTLSDYAFRFTVVLLVSVVKLYLHLMRGLVGTGLKKIGLARGSVALK